MIALLDRAQKTDKKGMTDYSVIPPYKSRYNGSSGICLLARRLGQAGARGRTVTWRAPPKGGSSSAAVRQDYPRRPYILCRHNRLQRYTLTGPQRHTQTATIAVVNIIHFVGKALITSSQTL